MEGIIGWAAEHVSQPGWGGFWKTLGIGVMCSILIGVVSFILGKINKFLGVIAQSGLGIAWVYWVWTLRGHVFWLVMLVLCVLSAIFLLIQAAKK
ncbi:MAG: hypothetical protein FWB83_10135 [Treponema sp.]|nr:hypothetical protein [Treponema sp.]